MCIEHIFKRKSFPLHKSQDGRACWSSWGDQVEYFYAPEQFDPMSLTARHLDCVYLFTCNIIRLYNKQRGSPLPFSIKDPWLFIKSVLHCKDQTTAGLTTFHLSFWIFFYGHLKCGCRIDSSCNSKTAAPFICQTIWIIEKILHHWEKG